MPPVVSELCIPPPPPVLSCDDASGTDFRVLPPDPHGLDADHDGFGCEEDEAPAPTPSPTPTPSATCDPAYPDVCIPPPPPDLDCGDIPDRNFRVLPPDPHRFDQDGNGWGCESD